MCHFPSLHKPHPPHTVISCLGFHVSQQEQHSSIPLSSIISTHLFSLSLLLSLATTKIIQFPWAPLTSFIHLALTHTSWKDSSFACSDYTAYSPSSFELLLSRISLLFSLSASSHLSSLFCLQGKDARQWWPDSLSSPKPHKRERARTRFSRKVMSHDCPLKAERCYHTFTHLSCPHLDVRF